VCHGVCGDFGFCCIADYCVDVRVGRGERPGAPGFAAFRAGPGRPAGLDERPGQNPNDRGTPGARVVLARGPAVRRRRRRAPSSRGAHTRRAPDGRPVRRGAALSMARAEAGDSMGDSQPTTGQARDAPEKPATHTPESGSTLVDFTSLISVLQQRLLAA
jgi:hypothetical protein